MHMRRGFTHAEGMAAHAEGLLTHAKGSFSHAEGSNSKATGHSSHSEGSETTAGGAYSHAEGKQTTALGEAAHAEGTATIANGFSLMRKVIIHQQLILQVAILWGASALQKKLIPGLLQMVQTTPTIISVLNGLPIMEKCILRARLTMQAERILHKCLKQKVINLLMSVISLHLVAKKNSDSYFTRFVHFRNI